MKNEVSRVKVYSVIGIGFLIGEKIIEEVEREGYICLKYPGVLSSIQTPEGIRDMIRQAIPTFVLEADEMLKRFPLMKDLILFEGTPDAKLFSIYKNFVSNLQERLTGIKMAPAGAINALPKVGELSKIMSKRPHLHFVK